MRYRLFFVLVTAFFVTMNVLLWRSEFGTRHGMGGGIPVDPAESDLAEIARALAQDGIATERRSGITPGIADAIVFRDPKGTLIEVFAGYAFATEDRRPGGIATIKLGHVAYRVPDIQGIVAFYTGILGFRVSDWRDDTFAFLRCGPDHHAVNFVVDPVPQLHHIAFEVKDWAEIQRACDLENSPPARNLCPRARVPAADNR